MLNVELVGPGFDAGDLNRGLISPLESHRFLMDESGRMRSIGSSKVDATTYSTMKSLRIRKVALKYIMKKRLFRIDDIGDREARITLESSGNGTSFQMRHLLSDEDYVSAPEVFLRNLSRYAMVVGSRADSRIANENMIAFFVSQILNGHLNVIWDIVNPHRKYALN